jgi:hypothetical protein
MSSALLLLTGIPGTGKTTVAEYLVAHHGYTHFDREQFDQWPKYLQVLWIRALPLFVWFVIQRYRQVVISWGFLPLMDNYEIRQLIDYGFRMIWFDGEREVARREFLKRGTATEEEFDAQVQRIERLHLATFPHVRVDPFGDDRQFVPVEERVARVLRVIL